MIVHRQRIDANLNQLKIYSGIEGEDLNIYIYICSLEVSVYKPAMVSQIMVKLNDVRLPIRQ